MDKKITKEDILNNPEIISTFTLEQLANARALFFNKRSTILRDVIRPALDKRERELKEIQRSREISRNIFNRVKSLWDRVGHLHLIEGAADHISYHARSIANDLHDLQEVWSGYESKRLYDLKQSSSSISKSMVCKEHYYPRQYSGTEIVNKIIAARGKYSFADFSLDVCNACHVHLVTPQENQTLRPYQLVDTFSNPRLAYQQAGVDLVKTKHDIENTNTAKAWYHFLTTLN